ncbi:site-specific integrase, partial [Methylomonas sp. SURF-2]
MATIRKLPSGSWQVQVRRKGESPISKSFSSKSLAEQWARSIESQIDHGCFVDRSEAERTTLGELIDRYLVEVTPTKKGSKQEAYRLSNLKKHLGSLVVASIQSKHIASYRDSRLKSGKSSGTVLRELCDVSHLFNVAIKDWGIPLVSNPARLVRKPPASKNRDRRLTPDEINELIRQLAETDEMISIVQLAIETGMRRSELLAMQWGNIDIKNRYVLLPDTKNGESRAVPLSSRAIEILEQLPKKAETVFITKPDSVSQAFHRACVRAGLDNLRFHDLRHEATSRLFEKGLNTMEVSSVTGHKTLGMLKRYTHLRAS